MKLNYEVNSYQVSFGSTIKNLLDLKLNLFYFLSFLIIFQGEINYKAFPILETHFSKFSKSIFIAIFFTFLMHCFNFIFNPPIFDKKDLRGQTGLFSLETTEDFLIITGEYLKIQVSYQVLKLSKIPLYYEILIPSQKPFLIPKSAKFNGDLFEFIHDLEEKILKKMT